MRQDGAGIVRGSLEGSQKDPAQRMRRVDDVMTREVVSLSPRHNFEDAVNLISSRNFHHFIVVDDGRIVGVVSDRDVLRGLARTPDWQQKQVNEFMTVDPMTVKPDTALAEAIGKMLDKKINCLPVVAEDGSVCGILTSTDLLKAYQRDIESVDFKHR